jgi:splicing factor 3A subunit 1
LEQREAEKVKKTKDVKVIEEEEDLEVDWDDFTIVKVIEFDEDDDNFIEPDIQQMGIEDVSNKIDRVENDIKRELFEMEGVRDASEAEPGMKIVTNYQRKKKEDKESTQICPKCGKAIPVSEWTEHMRIELLDSKWREEKIDDLKRQKNPMTAEGDEISRSLKNLMANRPDIATSDANAQFEALNQKPGSDGPKVIWDGHSNSITRTTANSAMLAQQQRRNAEDIMKNRPDMYNNGQNMPQGFNPMNAGMQLRPPTTAQLLGYQAPPPPNQGQNHQYGNNQQNRQNQNNNNNQQRR